MSALVQVFGRLQDDPTRVRRREASEKRQGTKSREVARLRCGGLYGDLITAGVMAVEDRAARAGMTCFLGRPETAGRAEKALEGSLACAESQGWGATTQAGTFRAEGRCVRRAALRRAIRAAVMTCRS